MVVLSKTGSTDLRLADVQQPNTETTFVFDDQLFCLASESRPVRFSIFDDGFQLTSENTPPRRLSSSMAHLCGVDQRLFR